MDKSNYNDVIALAKTEAHKNKVQLILNELFPDQNVDVPDPYFGEVNGFDQCISNARSSNGFNCNKTYQKTFVTYFIFYYLINDD